ncbi:MAG: ABC transporter, partial [Akkermansia sp.]|nr:ABC transporter [Akkermansia sp.]
RTLMKDAPTILLDEPTSGLDDTNTDIIKKLIMQDAAKRICIISTHDSRLFDLADEIIDFDNSVSC